MKGTAKGTSILLWLPPFSDGRKLIAIQLSIRYYAQTGSVWGAQDAFVTQTTRYFLEH